MEAKGLEFHRQVRELFLQQAKAEPARFAVVDASGSIEEVQGLRLLDAVVSHFKVELRIMPELLDIVGQDQAIGSSSVR